MSHNTILGKLPALMLCTLVLSGVQIRAGLIKRRETVTFLANSTSDSSLTNVVKHPANSLNPSLSTRLLPEKSGNLVRNKMETETLKKPSDYENLENKAALEETKTISYDVEIADNKENVPNDSTLLKGTSIIEEAITKPPNEISKNSNQPLEAQKVFTETTTTSKSEDFDKNDVFSHVNSAKIQFTSDNKISDGLDQQALNAKINPETLENEQVSQMLTTFRTIPTLSVSVPETSNPLNSQIDNVRSKLYSGELDNFELEATTMQLEPIAIKLQVPNEATTKSTTIEQQTNELLKPNNAIATTASTLTIPVAVAANSSKVTTLDATTNNSTFQSNENGVDDATPQRSANSSAEKRGKFINDNSTNTNKLQLPDTAEVWTLAGMKSVLMSKQNVSLTTERAPNERSSNSEKNLLDWSQIMLAKQDDKTFDNLIDSSTVANRKDTPRNTTTTYMPAATVAIEAKTELTKTALNAADTELVNASVSMENVTIFPNVDANTVLNNNERTTQIAEAANNDFVVVVTTANGSLSVTPTALLSSSSIDKSVDNTQATTLPSETERELEVMTNETTESTFILSNNNEQQNSSLSEPEEATSTIKSIEEFLQEATKTTTTPLPTQAAVGVKPGVTEHIKTTEMTTTLPDKHFSTSVQPPSAPATASAETNFKSHLNEHANASADDNNNNDNNNNVTDTNAFNNTTVEHNSSDTTMFSTPIASVVNTTIAIDQNKEEEKELVTIVNFEKIRTTTAIPAIITTTTADSELLTTSILATTNTKPITLTTTEANNHNGNEVDLDIGTEEQIDKIANNATTIATTTTTTTTKADDTITTSSDKNLFITTTAIATPNQQELPTLVTESVSAVNDTATTTQATTIIRTTTTTSIEDNIGQEEKPHETESSIETNAIDSVEKTPKTPEDKVVESTTTVNTTSSTSENKDNEDMLLPGKQDITSTTPPTIIQTSPPPIIITTTTTPSITSTTTEAPLISLLDDGLTTTTTTTTTTATATTTTKTTVAPPPPVDVTTENIEMYSVYSTTPNTTTTTTDAATTINPTDVPSTNTMITTLTSLIPKLIESNTSPPPPPIATNSAPHNIIYGANNNRNDDSGGGTDVNVIIAISVSCIGIVALVLLVAFLYVMRKRQKQMSYGQRCRPVSLDAYSMDNVSVFNSVRRKGATRSSKRSYGNVAFDDPSLKHHLLGATDLSKFIERRISIFEEFRDVPQITARADEVPSGCEDKNRYANVIPLPETRVVLQQQNDDEKTEYINANYVRGPKDTPNYYIACQAPLETTVTDFWRMIWEQQSRVIIQATDLMENGIEKCAEYLPPSITIDNHVTYGDYQITLKNREVKDKYAISTIMLKNIMENTSRELTHYWYKWPEAGVPQEEAPIIAMLLEARSSLKSYAIEQANELKEKSSTLTIKSDAANSIGKEVTLSVTSLEKSDEQKDTGSASGSQNGEINGNVTSDKLKAAARNQGPLTVHCSPGTGRTGTIIGCDIAIRCLETPKRIVDIPQIVYYVRRGRASAVQTKEQYEFIYKVANMYATKITNLSNDN